MPCYKCILIIPMAERFDFVQGITSIASPLGAGYRNTAAWDVVLPEHSCTEREQWPHPGKSCHVPVQGFPSLLG